ncbi:MAG TPA: hypothetical protein VD978_31495 [Azospirillum sp.]|nr:hypothetical protein [Azospirillum sp.]
MSKGVLKEIADDMVHVEGMAWLNGAAKKIPIKNFVAKVLCKRHNEMLSPLDVVAANCFRSLKYNAGGTPPSASKPPKLPLTVVSGHDFERWMIKCIIGAVAGKAIRNLDGSLVDLSSIPPECFDWMLGDTLIPEPLGAYMEGRLDQLIKILNQAAFAPVFDDKTGSLAGCLMKLYGFTYALALSQPFANVDGWNYRMTKVNFGTPSRGQLLMSWIA